MHVIQWVNFDQKKNRNALNVNKIPTNLMSTFKARASPKAALARTRDALEANRRGLFSRAVAEEERAAGRSAQQGAFTEEEFDAVRDEAERRLQGIWPVHLW